MVDGIEPDLLFDGRVEHGRVVGGVDGAKTWRQRANALIAVDLDFKNLYGQRIARFRAVDEEWSGQRIIAGCHAQGITGFLDGVAEAVHCIRLKDVAGFEMRHRTVGRGVSVFQLAGFQLVANNFAFFRTLRERGSGQQQHS